MRAGYPIHDKFHNLELLLMRFAWMNSQFKVRHALNWWRGEQETLLYGKPIRSIFISNPILEAAWDKNAEGWGRV